MPSLTLAELQARLGGSVRGDGSVLLDAVASLETARANQLGFLLGRKLLAQARSSGAGALIIPESLGEPLSQPCLAVANPHASIARALALFYPEASAAAGIDPNAHVAADCEIDATASIGPGCVVEAGARIGARSVLGPNCVIGARAVLGADCHLHARVTVQHGCVVGNRVVLHPGCVIGSDGFGLAWENESWFKVPQVGRAILGDDVEVGANTTIDRGALDDTVIEDGVKLDNQIQIAHNCHIGKHSAIAACVGIAGSTRIGAYCQIGGAAMIIGHLEIADRVTISAGTFVAKNIKEAGTYTSVQPLMRHGDWLRNASHLRHLDDLAQRIKSLEKQLEQP
ncbi:MAG: UDP-3-O-(3-hydroxymyristoyl)glucosamine N-acyltransferase [Pseudomonadota bacterium]|nr:UDP-3-O-(3-hydroxymyristoyl)glucosamine N-acyltransferase [Pseudomonadota bacterium]MDP1904869.1 UDP-3-O-(3-hydroxymyristoyl)glucosamine N-acyltransferase [Pseudomonadota bacterium]MDP2354352.1 UDP-3-O-(3-hydroxymyristoyl)glucosamine N-acyltransferase [Pseudomonadota bacterium]